MEFDTNTAETGSIPKLSQNTIKKAKKRRRTTHAHARSTLQLITTRKSDGIVVQ